MTEQTMVRASRYGFFERLVRLARYRLQIPMKRSSHPPEHVARGVMVGTMWAITPFFGAQMICVLCTWFAARKLFSWDFSLLNGLAWTWTTNAITIIPTYYVCWLTGKSMLGEFNDLTGYESFKTLVETDTSHGESWSGYISTIEAVAATWGLPMAIGSIPWAIFFGWLAYRLSLQFVVRYRHRRQSRFQIANSSK